MRVDQILADFYHDVGQAHIVGVGVHALPGLAAAGIGLVIADTDVPTRTERIHQRPGDAAIAAGVEMTTCG